MPKQKQEAEAQAQAQAQERTLEVVAAELEKLEEAERKIKARQEAGGDRATPCRRHYRGDGGQGEGAALWVSGKSWRQIP